VGGLHGLAFSGSPADDVLFKAVAAGISWENQIRLRQLTQAMVFW